MDQQLNQLHLTAIENEIGAYLLKKDNKLFNIAGKLSLNDLNVARAIKCRVYYR